MRKLVGGRALRMYGRAWSVKYVAFEVIWKSNLEQLSLKVKGR